MHWKIKSQRFEVRRPENPDSVPRRLDQREGAKSARVVIHGSGSEPMSEGLAQQPRVKKSGEQCIPCARLCWQNHTSLTASALRMVENYAAGISLVCLFCGGFLIWSSLSANDSSQLRVLGGAVLLATGLIAMWSVAKNRLQWSLKRYRHKLRPSH